MKENYILILGAGLMQKPAIQSGKDLGYKIALVDGNPNALCVPMAPTAVPATISNTVTTRSDILTLFFMQSSYSNLILVLRYLQKSNSGLILSSFLAMSRSFLSFREFRP